MKPKIVFLPHANLQYSQLPPGRRAWVARQSYEPLFDLVNGTEGYRLGFEASGISLRIMAEECPEVLAKLRAGIRAGRIEPVASPYTHIMLSNVDPEIGLYSLKDGLDAWEQYTGARPVTNAYVSDCRWPPLPTSPGRFNVEEAIADLKEANTRVLRSMERNGLADRKSLHSYELIESLILSVETELMGYPYFGESVRTETVPVAR